MGASKKQCEELLEFIRHLAEDDKEGVMAVKVCCLVVSGPHTLPHYTVCIGWKVVCGTETSLLAGAHAYVHFSTEHHAPLCYMYNVTHVHMYMYTCTCTYIVHCMPVH